MPLYDYKCPACGVFEQSHPMSTVPRSVPCPTCAEPSRKLMSGVGLSRLNTPQGRLLESTQASAYEPQVISGRPTPASRPNITFNPKHRLLPRP
ncbi:FmdB family zinc ribbon protein [Rothia sp. L_38]|uniref:FmdB family zinc ribbon protein n=1 Tax=Rothia sp. L_38 TaxID=3422315 RepID=UPI003D6AB302